jgi:NAD(P)-dependent dehydrogenase (short-subunit alcohol dehydrogenase family)
MPQMLLLHNTPTRSLLAHFSNTSDPGSRTITDMNLDGRVVIVTGATKGVGRGVGRELARHGARVFVTGRSAPDRERLDERITGIRCDHRVDVQAEAAFNLIVRETSTIDILVNNVWGGYERMIEDSNFTWSKPFWEQPMWRWDARRKIVWKCNHD